MSGRPSIRLEVPPSTVPISRTVPLAPDAGTLLAAMAQQELARYPAALQLKLPEVFLVQEAMHEGTAVRARFFAESNTGVLTPCLDLRGNVHRIVAAALLHRHTDAAESLRASVRSVGSEGHLYERSLSPEAQVAALVGAVVGRRATLGEARNQSPALRATLDAARAFLVATGFTEADLDALPEAPPYAYLTRLSGDHRICTMHPGDTDVHFAPPGSGDFPSAIFRSLDDAEVPLARRAITRALWTLPEGTFADAVRHVFVVSDVRYVDGTDIAGFASGYDGGSASVILEHQQGRQILYHEFGHALHFRHAERFPESEWLALVPASGGYLGSTKRFLEAEISLAPYSPELLQRGFVTAYGSSTLHEDVAEYLEALLGGDPRLWAATAEAPLVDAKVKLLIGFLNRIHPVFTRDHLERLCTERPLQEAMWGH